MPPLLRSILVVLAGAALSVLVVAGMDAVVGQLYPLPAGTDTKDGESLRRAIAAMPLTAFLLLLAGWVIAGAAGSFLAARLAARAPIAHGLFVACVLLAATIVNLMALPHPAWMWPAALVLIPLAGWGATRIVASARAAT